MSSEKTFIAVVIALGIAGSAALAPPGGPGTGAFGRPADATERASGSKDCVNADLYAGYAFDSHRGALDL